jgi:hypothetical protein
MSLPSESERYTLLLVGAARTHIEETFGPQFEFHGVVQVRPGLPRVTPTVMDLGHFARPNVAARLSIATLWKVVGPRKTIEGVKAFMCVSQCHASRVEK